MREAAMPKVGAVVLSDYAKGVLTERVIRAVIDAARRLGKPVIVDPKGHDYRVYRGATLITPNAKELAGRGASAARATKRRSPPPPPSWRGWSKAKPCWSRAAKQGMSLHVEGQAPIHIGLSGQGARRVRRRRHGGGGDGGAGWRCKRPTNSPCARPMRPPPWWSASAAPRQFRSANCATAFCRRLRSRRKTRSCSTGRCSTSAWPEWRRHGLRIGFTNGCFDLLHRGHVKLLAEARAACDRLVVGLNSDASTARLKGEGRPINPAEGRAEVLAALEAVDLVVVFEEDTPLELIQRVRPAVLVKGADYRIDEVVGRDVVEAAGGDVMLVIWCPANRPPAWCAARPRAGAPNKRAAKPAESESAESWESYGATHDRPSDAVGVSIARRWMAVVDWLAVAVAVSLPWSTSVTAILVAALDPRGAADLGRRRRCGASSRTRPPICRCCCGCWRRSACCGPHVSWHDRIGGLGKFHRLLVIPLLLIHFRRSERGIWVIYGFFAASLALLLASWALALHARPDLARQGFRRAGQRLHFPEHEFSGLRVRAARLCLRDRPRAAMAAHRRSGRARALFVANMFFVVTSRTALLVVPVLLVWLGWQEFRWRGLFGTLLLLVVARLRGLVRFALSA